MPWRCLAWRATSGVGPLPSACVYLCSHSIAQVILHQLLLRLVQSRLQDTRRHKALKGVSFLLQVDLRECGAGAAHEQGQCHGHAGGLCA